MSGDVTRDFAATSGVSDVDGIVQIEMGRNRRQIIGIVVHVVAVAGLRGAVVPAAVLGNDAIAVLPENSI
jgi:hypothetical protein